MSLSPLLGEKIEPQDVLYYDDTHNAIGDSLFGLEGFDNPYPLDEFQLDFPLMDQSSKPLLTSSSSEEGFVYDPSLEAKTLSPKLPAPAPMVGRKRGRPKGSKKKQVTVAPQVVPDRATAIAFAAMNPGEPNPFLVNIPTDAKEKDKNGDVFRLIAVYPSNLMDPKVVKCLDFMNEGTPEIRESILSSARNKLDQVLSGSYKFGAPVLIESFVPYRPPFTMVASPQNLFLWHAIMGHGVMTTRHGKVSVFPVTVFQSEKNLKAGVQGFPCLAVHVAHMKSLMWRMFSCCRNMPVCNETLSNQCHYRLEFNPSDDGPLIALSGFDVYYLETQKKEGGFMLFSAEYVDVMKHFFVTPDFCLRDIGTLLSQVYRDIPALKGKFTEEFRAIWLGEERQPNVVYMIGKGEKKDHSFGMTRARSLSGQVRFGRTGRQWIVCDTPANKQENYFLHSFAYGVQCWTEQLEWINSAYTYFTGHAVERTSHQLGLFELDWQTRVQSREACIKDGLLNDEEPYYRTAARLRRERTKLLSTYGEQFVRTFFGPENVRVYKKRAKTT